MPKDMELRQRQRQTQNLMMTANMQQALHILQLPVQELEEVVDEELANNPLLECEESGEESLDGQEPFQAESMHELTFGDSEAIAYGQLEDSFKEYFFENEPVSQEAIQKRHFFETLLEDQQTLFESLMEQAHGLFFTPEELCAAEYIFGSLEENGYLRVSVEQMSADSGLSVALLERVLKEVKQMEPAGVAASGPQEALLMQLRQRHQKDSIAYQMIKDHFNDLIHHRMPVLERKLHLSKEQIQEIIDEQITPLSLYPVSAPFGPKVPHIVPDAKISQEGESLVVYVDEGIGQRLGISKKYSKLLHNPETAADVKQYLKNKWGSARWLMRCLDQRKGTLYQVLALVAELQKSFFTDPKGALKPLDLKTVAEKMGVHESTVARAVAHKYVDTPRGLLELRSLFSQSYQEQGGGQIATKEVQKRVQHLILQEDKAHPLSDEAISHKLQEMGIPCARRTVTKYRLALGIGTAQQRRKY